MLNGITGLIEANNARIRGHIEADSGRFHGHIEALSGLIDNITIGDRAIFNGSIRSGNFVVEYGTFRRFPASGVFAQGTNATTIVNQLVTLGFPPASASPITVPV